VAARRVGRYGPVQADETETDMTGGEVICGVKLTHDGAVAVAEYAPAADPRAGVDPRAAVRGSGLPVGRKSLGYASYAHATGHVFASYCTSPFAAAGEPALVLVWDGGPPAGERGA
jgi:carbamoyltransferase